MGFLKRRRHPEDNFLRYVPTHRHGDYEVREGLVVLRFRHDRPVERLLRWLAKKPLTTELELDDLGSCVWLAMDGRRTVRELALLLEERFGERAARAQERLILYLRHLARRGWIRYRLGG